MVWFLSQKESRSGFHKNIKYLGEGKWYLIKEAQKVILINLLALEKELKMGLIQQWEVEIIEGMLGCQIDYQDANLGFLRLEQVNSVWAKKNSTSIEPI